MENLLLETQGAKHKMNIICNRVRTDLVRFCTLRPIDLDLLRSLESIEKDIERIQNQIFIDPRFDWIIIQEVISSMYKKDQNLSGVLIKFDWKEESLNRGIINYSTKKPK